MPKSKSEKPWERQQGESDKAYEAFSVYRDLQGSARTFTAVAEKLQKSGTLIRRWKAKFSWESRALAYDNYLQAAAAAEAQKQKQKMTERHIQIAEQLQYKALEALKNLKPDQMSPKDIKEFLKMATDLEAACRSTKLNEASPANSGQSSLADIITAAYAKRSGNDD